MASAPDGVGGRVRFDTLHSEPPITLRLTPDALYVVGSAAGPVGGDSIRFDITVGDGAEVVMRSVAAQIVLPGPTGLESFQHTEVIVGAGGRLVYRPEPVIAVQGCRHVMSTRISLAPDAELIWEDTLVLGRHNEGPGSILQRMRIDRGGLPLYRNDLALGPAHEGYDTVAVLGDARSIATEIRIGAGPVAEAHAEGDRVHDLHDAHLDLAPDALLRLTLG